MDLVTIRPAIQDDDPERVFGLLWQLAPDDPRPDPGRLAKVWEEIHQQPGRCLLLAMCEDEPVGTVDTVLVPNLTRMARPYMLVENMVVDARHRRRGIGGLLMAAAEARARSAGCYKIQLLSNARRSDAHRFYEAAGLTASSQGYRRYL
jgi:GNAT superfamily N-acetyltransferase